jgi:hypothetical protein
MFGKRKNSGNDFEDQVSDNQNMFGFSLFNKGFFWGKTQVGRIATFCVESLKDQLIHKQSILIRKENNLGGEVEGELIVKMQLIWDYYGEIEKCIMIYERRIAILDKIIKRLEKTRLKYGMNLSLEEAVSQTGGFYAFDNSIQSSNDYLHSNNITKLLTREDTLTEKEVESELKLCSNESFSSQFTLNFNNI